MTKTLVSLMLAILAIATSYAQSQTKGATETTSLKQAFTEISQLPNVNVKVEANSWDIINNDRLDNAQLLYATGLNREQIEQTGNDIYRALDKVGLQYMINGANNHLVALFIYANQIADNRNELLLVLCSGAEGSVNVAYGITDNNTVQAMQQARLTIAGPYISFQDNK